MLDKPRIQGNFIVTCAWLQSANNAVKPEPQYLRGKDNMQAGRAHSVMHGFYTS